MTQISETRFLSKEIRWKLDSLLQWFFQETQSGSSGQADQGNTFRIHPREGLFLLERQSR